MNENIKNGAVQYATYISQNIPQTENETLKYYFSGSLAMLLLSAAKRIQPVKFDQSGNIIEHSPEIQASEETQKLFSRGLRQISMDIDIIELDESTFINKALIFNTKTVVEKCDLATSLCPSWGKYATTMYFDILSDDRKISGHNVVIIELENGKKVAITNPVDLMIHKFCEMLSVNLSHNSGIKKYNKDINDFACLFNGVSKLGMLPEDFKKYLETMTQNNQGSTVNKLQNYDCSERITKILQDMMPHIESDSQEVFKGFIVETTEFNKEQIAKSKQ